MARLQDKVALNTGGESGIELATARLFVAEGARVHLVGIDEAKLAAAVEELGGGIALSSVAEITDESAVAAVAVRNRSATSDRCRGQQRWHQRGVSEIVDYPDLTSLADAGGHVLGALSGPQAHHPHVNDGGQHHHHLERRRPIGGPGSSGYISRAKHGQVGLMRTGGEELAPRRQSGRTRSILGLRLTPFQGNDIEMRGPACRATPPRRRST